MLGREHSSDETGRIRQNDRTLSQPDWSRWPELPGCPDWLDELTRNATRRLGDRIRGRTGTVPLYSGRNFFRFSAVYALTGEMAYSILTRVSTNRNPDANQVYDDDRALSRFLQ
jgi:hypothetical protein